MALFLSWIAALVALVACVGLSVFGLGALIRSPDLAWGLGLPMGLGFGYFASRWAHRAVGRGLFRLSAEKEESAWSTSGEEQS
jgi:hypothetical protein